MGRHTDKPSWRGTRGTSTERGYGHAWRKARNAAMARDKGLCQVCKRAGRVTQATEVDHIQQKADGGTDDAANLQAICAPCHQRKTIEDNGGRWRERIGLDGWPVDS